MRQIPPPLAGVIGSPIAHSLSPRLHRHWLARYEIAGHYVAMDVTAADLSQVLAAMPRMGFRGGNVTIPHKEAVLDLADEVSDRAAAIGAANTLIFREDGCLLADNTDGIGFIENLRTGAPGWSAADGPAAILGAGGAARAIVEALLGAGAPEIRIANRTTTRAEALRGAFGPRLVVHDWSRLDRMLDGAATVVNTTSLGMSGNSPLDLPPGVLSPDMVVSDIVYAPLETDLLRLARMAGAVAVDGLGMLIHQAVPGFERWFGRRPQVDTAVRNVLLAS